jgi:hypothetical protein
MAESLGLVHCANFRIAGRRVERDRVRALRQERSPPRRAQVHRVHEHDSRVRRERARREQFGDLPLRAARDPTVDPRADVVRVLAEVGVEEACSPDAARALEELAFESVTLLHPARVRDCELVGRPVLRSDRLGCELFPQPGELLQRSALGEMQCGVDLARRRAVRALANEREGLRDRVRRHDRVLTARREHTQELDREPLVPHRRSLRSGKG